MRVSVWRGRARRQVLVLRVHEGHHVRAWGGSGVWGLCEGGP